MKNSLILALSVIIALTACGTKDKKKQLEALKKDMAALQTKIETLEKETGGDSTKAKATEVQIKKLTLEVFKNYIEIQGKVDADENIVLSSEMPGTVTKINVKVGDAVRVGQILAETDNKALLQGVSELQNGLDFATTIFEKQKNLWEQKIGTEVQFLQAKNTKESLEKKMTSMQEQIRMTRVVSPISGTVDAVDIKIGQAIAPGMPAIRVVNFNNLKVKAEIAESYASKIKKGAEVIVRFPDMDDSIISKINFAARSIGALNRTFTVEVLLDNKKEYHPNMVTRLSINDYQSPSPTIVVPINTLQKDETGEYFVFIANGNTAQKKVVKVGKKYSGRAEIISGIAAGDNLIFGGFESLNDGDLITVK